MLVVGVGVARGRHHTHEVIGQRREASYGLVALGLEQKAGVLHPVISTSESTSAHPGRCVPAGRHLCSRPATRTVGPMATIELTGENFESSVEENDVLFVDFWASWCGPCRQFAPTYEAASEANPDLTFGSVNTEEQHALAGAAQVSSIPTLMVFRDGILVFSQPGALPPPALDELISAVRALDMDDVRRQISTQQPG
jgi:thioredoxin 1